MTQVLVSWICNIRKRIEAVFIIPEDTAGGLMNTDVVAVRSDLTVEAVLRYLRNYATLPHNTDSLVVVDYQNSVLGSLSLSSLLTDKSDDLIKDLINKEIDVIPVTLSSTEVASLFERHNLLSAPVVIEKGLLIGRITVDDVVDVIIEEADHSLLNMAGLDESVNTFDSVTKSTKRRAIWLGINLVTAIMAASVVDIFDGTIHQVVALAVLMPIL